MSVRTRLGAIFNFPLRLIFRSKERTSFRWMKGTYLKANFRLWLESGWRHALVGAELGKVLLTVHTLCNLDSNNSNNNYIKIAANPHMTLWYTVHSIGKHGILYHNYVTKKAFCCS